MSKWANHFFLANCSFAYYSQIFRKKRMIRSENRWVNSQPCQKLLFSEVRSNWNLFWLGSCLGSKGWKAVLRSRSRWNRNALRPGAGAEIIFITNLLHWIWSMLYCTVYNVHTVEWKKNPLRHISYETIALCSAVLKGQSREIFDSQFFSLKFWLRNPNKKDTCLQVQ